jgi:hypothetical protein
MLSAVEKTTVHKVSGLGRQGLGATQRPPPVSAGFGGLASGNTAKQMTGKSLFQTDVIFLLERRVTLGGLSMDS